MRQNITVKIAGKEYSLAVEPDLEEAIRTAAERVDEAYTFRMDLYGNVSDKEVLSMLLLEEESKLVEMQLRDNGDARKMAGEIEALNAELDEYLLSR